MYIKQRIFTAMLMLFVITGQTMAVQGANGCDMDMHQMDALQMEMGHMDHSQMNHDMIDMEKPAMSCCDDAVCALDCSLVMTSILSEQASLGIDQKAVGKIAILSTSIFKRSQTSLFRPPISS